MLRSPGRILELLATVSFFCDQPIRFRPGSVSVRIYRAYESAFLPQGRPFNRPAYLAYFLFWLDTDNAEICHRLCIKPDTPTDNWQIDLPQSVRQFLEFGGFLPR